MSVVCACGCGTAFHGIGSKNRPIKYLPGHHRHGYVHPNRGQKRPDPREKVVQKFWAHVQRDTPDECWEWTGWRTPDYGYGRLWNAGQVLAHRFAYEIAHDVCLLPTTAVCHTCDNPPCVNPAHLWLGDFAANNRDRALKGRSNTLKGEQNHAAQLTETQAREILARYQPCYGAQTRLAREYGVSHGVICELVNRHTWQHLG